MEGQRSHFWEIFQFVSERLERENGEAETFILFIVREGTPIIGRQMKSKSMVFFCRPFFDWLKTELLGYFGFVFVF